MLKANVKTIDVVSHENGVVVFQDNGHESRFVPHSTGPLSDVQRTLESQLSDATASVKEKKTAKRMLNHLLQTMIVPNVEIEFSNILFGKGEIPSKENSVNMNLDELAGSTWADLLRKAISTFNNLVRDLYIHEPDSRILSSIYFPSGNLVNDLAYCKTRLRCPNGSILLPKFNATVSLPSNSIGFVTINNAILDTLRSESLENRTVDVIWEYLISAEQRFSERNYRHAIIDTDIAAGIAVRAQLKCILGMKHEVFEELSRRSSTGELIKTLRLVSAPRDGIPIAELEALHSIRNTILHRNQRRVGKEAIGHYKSIRDWILALNAYSQTT